MLILEEKVKEQTTEEKASKIFFDYILFHPNVSFDKRDIKGIERNKIDFENFLIENELERKFFGLTDPKNDIELTN